MLCAFGHVVGVNSALEITFMNYELYLLFVVACVCSLYRTHTILDSWLQLCLLQCIYGEFCYIIIVLRKTCLVSLAILSRLSRFSLTADRQKLTFMY